MTSIETEFKQVLWGGSTLLQVLPGQGAPASSAERVPDFGVDLRGDAARSSRRGVRSA